MKVLAVLAAAQFLMVLDQAVMNVSISQLVEDFDTDVTTIQAVITFYSLVMAALMIAGGKLGDIMGRRRAFGIGHAIYGAGSLLTAVSWSVPVLTLGWSVLEGIGAALVLPALAALTARSFEGERRAFAYGVLGGVAGAGIAVGPIVGGWVTTYLSWRVVFGAEVVVVIGILLGLRLLPDDKGREGAELDKVGALLSAAGLAGDRAGGAEREHVGLARAAQLADRAVRLLARPVPLRGRDRGAGPVRRLAAPARAGGARAARPPAPAARPAAARAGC